MILKFPTALVVFLLGLALVLGLTLSNQFQPLIQASADRINLDTDTNRNEARFQEAMRQSQLEEQRAKVSVAGEVELQRTQHEFQTRKKIVDTLCTIAIILAAGIAVGITIGIVRLLSQKIDQQSTHIITSLKI